MIVKQVIVMSMNGTIGKPLIHSKLLLSHKSSKIIGSTTITHMTRAETKRNNSLRIKRMRRPAIKSEAICIARIGYKPGADTATRAMTELDKR